MYANVLIDNQASRANDVFEYACTDAVSVGARVKVSFGRKTVEGFVMDIHETPQYAVEKIKPITCVMDAFVCIKPEVISILDEICDTFKLRKIDVLRLFVPSTVRGRVRPRKVKNAIIRARDIAPVDITLTPEQRHAIDEIAGGGGEGCSKSPPVFVLHGVTGSGKTEVYMQVIERVLARGKTAIMLVPEIGLTPQVLGNFRNRFGDSVAILHSGLTAGERFDEWYRLFTGVAKIAVGARSAVFAPLENIGVIIIDEEHDASYIADNNPRFDTHGVALIRARYWNGTVVMGSATPSISTYAQTRGAWKLLTLDKRVGDVTMPEIEIVDMIAEIKSGNGGIFSRELIEKLIQVDEKKQQAIIFLNRRGYSASVTCKECGWVAKCENCDVPLVYHRDDKQLKCHFCASRFSMVTQCPKCGSGYLKYGSTGTQKLVDELQRAIPHIKIFRMDTDSIKNKDELTALLDEFAATKPAVLVGTQMIAKGHHFPAVTLVGIVDADASLHQSDFRAAERTFALITQVAGRCGRAGERGYVVLQTLMPKNYVYKLAKNYDYKGFFDKEINARAVTKYPPFTTIVRVLVAGVMEDKIKDVLKDIMAVLRPRSGDFMYLGAMKSPMGRIDGKFRYQILARFDCKKQKEMLDFIDGAVRTANPRGNTVFLEINPKSLS